MISCSHKLTKSRLTLSTSDPLDPPLPAMDIVPGFCDCSMCMIKLSTPLRQMYSSGQLVDSPAFTLNEPADGLYELQQRLDDLCLIDENESTVQELTIDGAAPGADDDMRTVFNDPTTFNVKHPLYSSWTLWFDSPNTKNKTGTG